MSRLPPTLLGKFLKNVGQVADLGSAEVRPLQDEGDAQRRCGSVREAHRKVVHGNTPQPSGR